MDSAMVCAVDDRQEIVKLDAEIFHLQEKLREFEALKARLDELQKKRGELLELMEKKKRERVK